MIVGVLLLLGAALCAQSQPNEPANTDPVVCFDGVYRDARNALQAYQIAVGTYWKQEVDCRQRAPGASELGPCWDTLLQARPLIEQAADLYERARRAHLQQDAEPLTQQGNALMRRAANLVQQAGKCFDPIFARWQQNGGKYVAGDEFHVGTGPAPANPPDTPPGWPPGRPVPPQGTPPAMPPQAPAPQPGQRPAPRQSEHACSPPPAALVQAAEAAAEAIAANADPSALNRLNRAQHTLPPNCPLPIQCWDMMIDAQSKRHIAPDYSTRRAQQAVACYAARSDTPRLHGGVSTTPEEQQQRSSPGDSGQDLPLPANVRQQLMKAAARMDDLATDAQNYSLAATNHFFKCLVEVLNADLRFLAQPGYVPVKQIADSLHRSTWAYLTSNASDNNFQLFQGAVQALKNFAQDPACALATAAPGAAVALTTHLAGASAEATEAQNAANAAVRLANQNAERRAAWGAGPGKVPNNRYNPTCAPNMCFPSSIALDLTLETGEPLSARPATPTAFFAGNVEIRIIQGTPTKVFNLTHDFTIRTLLKDLYGSKPLQGPALSLQRVENQLAGIPSLSSYQDILQELRDAKSGSRGLVFLEYPATAGNPYGDGHVINAVNDRGIIRMVDASNGNLDGTSFFQNARVSFFRTK